MFGKKKEDGNEEENKRIIELEERLDKAEKRISLILNSTEKLVTSYVTRKERFEDVQERLKKIEKEVEREKVGYMYK